MGVLSTFRTIPKVSTSPPYGSVRLLRWRQKTDKAMLLFAASSIPILLLGIVGEELPGHERFVLQAANSIILAVFVVDYLVELFLVEEKIRYVRREWLMGIIILLSIIALFPIVPFVGGAQALRLVVLARPALAAIRALAVGAEVFHVGRGQIARQVTVSVFQASFFVWLTTAAAILLAEGIGSSSSLSSASAALWWSWEAMNPGLSPQAYPDTTAGKYIYAFAISMGLVVFTVLVADVASVFSKERSQDKKNPPS